MFTPADFSPPPKPRVPLRDDRTIGGALFVIALLIILIMVTALDQQIFNPFNATQSAIETRQAAIPTRVRR